MGYAIETASTGAEAVARGRTQTYDAIKLDLVLPDMDGHEAAAAIRSDSVNRDTPVIVVSVAADAGVHVHDLLPKPTPRAELLASLRRVSVSRDSARPILVVDDDPQVLKLAERTLRRLGYRGVCRSDVEGALERRDREPPSGAGARSPHAQGSTASPS